MIDCPCSVDILLEDNQHLRRALEKKVLPKREFMRVPIGGGLRKYIHVSFVFFAGITFVFCVIFINFIVTGEKNAELLMMLRRRVGRTTASS